MKQKKKVVDLNFPFSNKLSKSINGQKATKTAFLPHLQFCPMVLFQCGVSATNRATVQFQMFILTGHIKFGNVSVSSAPPHAAAVRPLLTGSPKEQRV